MDLLLPVFFFFFFYGPQRGTLVRHVCHKVYYSLVHATHYTECISLNPYFMHALHFGGARKLFVLNINIPPQ